MSTTTTTTTTASPLIKWHVGPSKRGAEREEARHLRYYGITISTPCTIERQGKRRLKPGYDFNCAAMAGTHRYREDLPEPWPANVCFDADEAPQHEEAEAVEVQDVGTSSQPEPPSEETLQAELKAEADRAADLAAAEQFRRQQAEQIVRANRNACAERDLFLLTQRAEAIRQQREEQEATRRQIEEQEAIRRQIEEREAIRQQLEERETIRQQQLQAFVVWVHEQNACRLVQQAQFEEAARGWRNQWLIQQQAEAQAAQNLLQEEIDARKRSFTKLLKEELFFGWARVQERLAERAEEERADAKRQLYQQECPRKIKEGKRLCKKWRELRSDFSLLQKRQLDCAGKGDVTALLKELEDQLSKAQKAHLKLLTAQRDGSLDIRIQQKLSTIDLGQVLLDNSLRGDDALAEIERGREAIENGFLLKCKEIVRRYMVVAADITRLDPTGKFDDLKKKLPGWNVPPESGEDGKQAKEAKNELDLLMSQLAGVDLSNEKSKEVGNTVQPNEQDEPKDAIGKMLVMLADVDNKSRVRKRSLGDFLDDNKRRKGNLGWQQVVEISIRYDMRTSPVTTKTPITAAKA
ncbi:MAG: hypothetical protein M1828_003177 [Chrysothrix sp. TS-e1954]|nr:MAG: hypothetical protein M1828_003177 [Chrysothrix sp. TS-e1954]